MNATSHQAIEELIRQRDFISERYQSIVGIAQREVDRYWTEFRLRNISIIAAMNRGETESASGAPLQLGRLAPRVKRYKDGLCAIEWRLFKGSHARMAGELKNKKQAKHIGETIKQPVKGFTAATFRARGCADWEIDMAMRSEDSFVLLRSLMNANRKYLRVLNTQLNNIKKLEV